MEDAEAGQKEVAGDDALSGSARPRPLEPGTLDELEEWDGCPGSSSDGRRAAVAALSLPASSGAAVGVPAGSDRQRRKAAAPAEAQQSERSGKRARQKSWRNGEGKSEREWTESDDEDETANVGDMMPWAAGYISCRPPWRTARTCQWRRRCIGRPNRVGRKLLTRREHGCPRTAHLPAHVCRRNECEIYPQSCESLAPQMSCA